MMQKNSVALAIIFSILVSGRTINAQQRPEVGTALRRAVSSARVIDVHLHAEKLDSYIAAQKDTRWFPRDFRRATSNEELMASSLAALKKLNAVAVTSEELETVEVWHRGAPERIIPALLCVCDSPAEITMARKAIQDGRIRVLGELVWQYVGLLPSDPKLDGLWALAQETDTPMGIHMGLTPSGWSQTVNPDIRIRNGSPLLLEEALVKHPKARVYVMHAGWPYQDEMIAMLHQYPALYVDVAWIDWYLPKAEFHAYLKRLVQAGFGQRLMFGSDQMQWPDAIAAGVHAIESADFLSSDQKREILHDNAVRFFRLDASR